MVAEAKEAEVVPVAGPIVRLEVQEQLAVVLQLITVTLKVGVRL